MSTRAANARHVRQRKLNTKTALRIIREDEIEDAPDQEGQGHIPQVETGVEKGEEVEFHLQAVINAANASALGAKDKQNYIPTPDAVKAKGVKYDELYPKVFSQPATYIRFSSTVEDCNGVTYCMNEADAKFLEQLNDGKDVNGLPIKEKLHQCSEDAFEEVMNSLEEISQRVQPFANLDSAPVLTLEEMGQNREEALSADAQRFLKMIYDYWVSKKGIRPLMPTIKVRVLDTTSESDDADPYVCFRRREVRQTRKTRGRDAQVVEKLKKLRLELEQSRSLVAMTKQREELNKQNLELSRKTFEQRKQLKEVKVAKNIIGEKGEDEELLVNQKPVPKPKSRPDGSQQRASTTLRLSTRSDRAPESDLVSLADLLADAESHVTNTVDSRKDQHRKWNKQWQDRTWDPITPPPETVDEPPKWAPLLPEGFGYPTPPPSLPSRSSQDRDGDVDMTDKKPPEQDVVAGADTQFDLFVPRSFPLASYDYETHSGEMQQNPVCRIRYGRGGRMHLEMRKSRPRAQISRGVVSDSESDDEMEAYYPVSEATTFNYRSGHRARPEGEQQRKRLPSGDQTAMTPQQQAAAASVPQQVATGGSA